MNTKIVSTPILELYPELTGLTDIKSFDYLSKCYKFDILELFPKSENVSGTGLTKFEKNSEKFLFSFYWNNSTWHLSVFANDPSLEDYERRSMSFCKEETSLYEQHKLFPVGFIGGVLVKNSFSIQRVSLDTSFQENNTFLSFFQKRKSLDPCYISQKYQSRGFLNFLVNLIYLKAKMSNIEIISSKAVSRTHDALQKTGGFRNGIAYTRDRQYLHAGIIDRGQPKNPNWLSSPQYYLDGNSDIK